MAGSSFFQNTPVNENTGKAIEDLLQQAQDALAAAQTAQTDAEAAQAAALAAQLAAEAALASVPSTSTSPWKNSVKTIALSPTDLSAVPAAINGYNLQTGDRWLEAAQSNPVDNGLYEFTVAGAAAVRAFDMDAPNEAPEGTTVYVADGDDAERFFTLTSQGDVTPGTTAMTWQDILSISGNLAALPRPYDFGASAAGDLVDNELIMQLPAVRPFIITENFAGSRAILGTGPTNILIIDVLVNGTSVGVITFGQGSTTGNFAAANPNQKINIAPGDVISFQAPADALGAVSLAVSFYGQVEE